MDRDKAYGYNPSDEKGDVEMKEEEEDKGIDRRQLTTTSLNN